MKYLDNDGLSYLWTKSKEAFAAKSDIPDTSEYQTASQVNAAIESYIASLGNAEGGSY